MEHFLRQISKVRYLYSSEETQVFIRGLPCFHKSSIAEKEICYKLISFKYSKIFSQYQNFNRTAEIEKEISVILGHLNNGISNLEKLSTQSHENSTILKNFGVNLDKFMNIVADTRAFYGDNRDAKNLIVQIHDPYNNIIEWCRNNLLSISGFIECIYRQYELQRYKTAIVQKIEDKELEILKCTSGKKKTIQYFNHKPNEYYIGKIEAEITQLRELINALDNILNITAALIIYQDYPNFKEEKKNDLNKGLAVSYARHQEIFAIFSTHLHYLDSIAQ